MAIEDPTPTTLGLVNLDAVCEELALAPGEVYWLVSTRQLPASLVAGRWLFDLSHVREWIDRQGGREVVRVDTARQVAKHFAAHEHKRTRDHAET